MKFGSEYFVKVFVPSAFQYLSTCKSISRGGLDREVRCRTPLHARLYIATDLLLVCVHLSIVRGGILFMCERQQGIEKAFLQG